MPQGPRLRGGGTKMDQNLPCFSFLKCGTHIYRVGAGGRTLIAEFLYRGNKVKVAAHFRIVGHINFITALIFRVLTKPS